MAGTFVAVPPEQKIQRIRTKVKTGCATCRTRKIKCDEKRPFCQKCVSTGRTCDGYESPFRVLTSQSSANSAKPVSAEVTPEDIDLLSRYFSTKTMFDVKLGCDEEARQILQASLTDPPVRHAVASLRALREHLETVGGVAASEEPPLSPTPSEGGYDYGLQQYCKALAGLASNLSSSSPGPGGLKSALLCCQIFISIEQVRGNYAAMAKHIVQGLGIMNECRARPNLVAAAANSTTLVPAHRGQLPLLDVFVIKVFAAPCKFAEPPATADASATAAAPACPMSSPQRQEQQAGESRRDHRNIAPDMRTELTRIARSTLDFLDEVARVDSVADALRLLSEKEVLLSALESWLVDLESVQTRDMRPAAGLVGPELLSVSFLRLFHQILRVVLLGQLNSSPDRYADDLRTENERVQSIAGDIQERVKAYRTSGGAGKES